MLKKKKTNYLVVLFIHSEPATICFGVAITNLLFVPRQSALLVVGLLFKDSGVDT